MQEVARHFQTVLCLVLITTAPIYAQESSIALSPEQAKEAKGIFEQVFSPFCPGRSLNDCPSQKAHDLKEQIKSDVVKGKPTDQIVNELLATYGDSILAVPRFTGVGMIAWALPLLFLCAGLYFLARKVRPVRRSAGPAASEDSELEARVAREMERFDA